MKKQTKNTIKRVIILVFVVILILSLVVPTIISLAYAENLDNELLIMSPLRSNLTEDLVYGNFENFVSNFPNRYDDKSIDLVSDFLKNEMERCGLTPFEEDFVQAGLAVVPSAVQGENAKTLNIKNVIGVQKSKTENAKQVVISAHFDTVQFEGGGQGAFDNGTGVAVLLSLMEVNATKKFDFDIVYAFFDKEEEGLYGSEHFVSNLNTIQKSNILLNINLDSIAFGDFSYIYTDEIPSLHEELFLKASSEIGFDLKSMPKDKKEISLYADKKPFIHLGHQSDHNTFANENIPVAFLFSYNLESKEDYYGVEKEGYTTLIHTENDNLNELISRDSKEQIARRLTQTALTISNVLNGSDFIQIMENSASTNPINDVFYSEILYYGAPILVLIILAIVVYIIAKKEGKVQLSKEDIEKLKRPTQVVISVDRKTGQVKTIRKNPFEDEKDKKEDKFDDPFDL